ncbi:MAG: geranylgeranyl reductase family protein [Bacteroidales bacterium]|jgi:geranylgeranyl reductase family protein|nr:geranylgeranyl reductase family protein [Bacteroidales bacterium]
MITDADVIIAGAGPAGSLAAYELAIHGVRVLILEKSSFPRYKVCGAGLTHKIIREIPFDISPVIETIIHTVQFSSHCRDVFTRISPVPVIYCSMREKLDAFLLDQAVSAGAQVHFGEQVRTIIQNGNQVEVTTNKGIFRSTLLIGAEGASGGVARSAGLRGHIMTGLAWEAEVKTNPDIVRKYAQTVFLDWGTFPGGYGWAFPKADHFSIGVGGPASLSKHMMPYYDRFIRYLGRYIVEEAKIGMPDAGWKQNSGSDGMKWETISLRSWPIPVRVKKGNFHDKQILVTGDEAGLTDPLTGEGIYYAVRSGKLAAAACLDYLESKTTSLEKYSESVNNDLMNELLEANRIKYLFNIVPLKIHHLVRDNDRVWRAFGKVLRGERWYADVRNGFGKWKFLWGFTCLLSKWISGYREKRYRTGI